MKKLLTLVTVLTIALSAGFANAEEKDPNKLMRNAHRWDKQVFSEVDQAAGWAGRR